jgi:glyoxylase-like metal-dependent hydrolase (beta-lactamase superfamily II)
MIERKPDAQIVPSPGSPIPSIRIGAFTVRGLSDGLFRLDGGAMFGVVPKVLWERISPADDLNRILMGLNPVLIQGPSATLLVETGVGSRHDAAFAERFAIQQPPTLVEGLAAVGLQPEDVDFVVNTHLHWDHAGGNTIALPDGRLAPTFPRATYVAQSADWEEAIHPHERNHGSYRPDDYRPIAEAGRLRLVDGDAELVEGVRLERVGGHTRGHQLVRVSSGGETLLFLADLVPTTRHVEYAWLMGYDLYPVETLEQKKRLIPQGAAEGWVVAFAHDPEHHFGRIRLERVKGRERPVFEELAPRVIGDR